jgi:hypothetical protein
VDPKSALLRGITRHSEVGKQQLDVNARFAEVPIAGSAGSSSFGVAWQSCRSNDLNLADSLGLQPGHRHRLSPKTF